MFRPLLDYLEEAESMRTVSEIEEHFKMEGADFACEWLVEKGLLQKMSAPLRLTEKSRVEMQEALITMTTTGPIGGCTRVN